MTACDVEPKDAADAVYLFGQTSDNESSVLNMGTLMVQTGSVSHVLVCDGEADHGYPGFRDWEQALFARGIKKEKIVPVLVHGGVNTLTEADSLVRFCRERDLQRVYITAAPFHQLRAFITVVSVLLREYPTFCVYNKPGVAFDWHESVRHSQGILEATRQELIEEELKRIERYNEKGDLVSPAEVLIYLKERDKR